MGLWIDTSKTSIKKMKQQNIHNDFWREHTEEIHQFLAHWVYKAGIPFHSMSHDSFRRFVEVTGQFGSGYKSPTQYQLREFLLKK